MPLNGGQDFEAQESASIHQKYSMRLQGVNQMALFHCMVRYGSARLGTVRYGSVRVGLHFHRSLVPL